MPSILRMIKTSPKTQLFANLVRNSELTTRDLGPGYTMFLTPRDSTCSPADREMLDGLRDREAARSYVLNHALKGDVTIEARDARVIRANYFPTRDPASRVIVDETHPLTVRSLGGRSIAIALKNGVLHIGSATVLDGRAYGTNDGSKVELDRCASL
jgi:hypothetical protein